jgi:energy-converting hydrogenase A subunit M
MKDETEQTAELDRLQAAYKAAVDRWVRAIREEEALASVNHSVAEVDQWEAAHFREDELRDAVIAAKREYEDALRREFFNF